MPPPRNAANGRLNGRTRRGVGFGRRSFSFVTLPADHSAAQWFVLPSKYLMASWSAVQVPSTPKIQAPVLPKPGLLLGRLRSARAHSCYNASWPASLLALILKLCRRLNCSLATGGGAYSSLPMRHSPTCWPSTIGPEHLGTH